MASLLIRNLDDDLKARLRVRAAERGHSMEEEARKILRENLATEVPAGDLADLAARLFGGKGGVDLDLDPRVLPPDPPDL